MRVCVWGGVITMYMFVCVCLNEHIGCVCTCDFWNAQCPLSPKSVAVLIMSLTDVWNAFCSCLLQAFVAEAMLIMATIIHLGKSGLSEKVSSICWIGCFWSFAFPVIFVLIFQRPNYIQYMNEDWMSKPKGFVWHAKEDLTQTQKP